MNPQHLLELAERMVTSVAGRPRQSDLRRAVSTIYYALFHLLTQSGAKLITNRDYLRPQLARRFNHMAMRSVSEEFGKGRIPGKWAAQIPQVPAELARIAKLFVSLQQDRHRADYDGNSDADFYKSDVYDILVEAKVVFAHWPELESHPAAELYLLAMLFQPLGR